MQAVSLTCVTPVVHGQAAWEALEVQNLIPRYPSKIPRQFKYFRSLKCKNVEVSGQEPGSECLASKGHFCTLLILSPSSTLQDLSV